MNTPAPRFRHPKNAPGDYLVIWWVPVRNRRGTVTLDPRTLRFETEESARIAARDKANAREVWVSFKGERLDR